MVDLDDSPVPETPHERGGFSVPSLVLAPAVLRIVISGKDIDTELDALVKAVAILQGSDGFMRTFVYEMAATLAQEVAETGTKGLAEAAKAGLSPDEAAMALQIALVAVFSSPLGEDGDIGILSAIAERIGVPEAEFSEIYDSTRRVVAQR
ncbi:MAG: hypothetical protein R3D59_01585 [Paracoccaceae bacterium]|nr:hypothetical protein [Maritimibacter sp.]